MHLSANFTLAEMTASETAARLGLDNTVPEALMPALVRTCEGLERIRALVRKPIVVLSGYRAPAVNAAVGGSARSQHMAGQAADIICPGLDGGPIMLASLIRDHLAALGVDQLIHEFETWTHVSFIRQPRGAVLTINRRGTHQGLVA